MKALSGAICCTVSSVIGRTLYRLVLQGHHSLRRCHLTTTSTGTLLCGTRCCIGGVQLVAYWSFTSCQHVKSYIGANTDL